MKKKEEKNQKNC